MKGTGRVEVVSRGRGHDSTVRNGSGKSERYLCGVCNRMRSLEAHRMCGSCSNKLRTANGLPQREEVDPLTYVRPPKEIDPARLRKYGLTVYKFHLLAEQQGGKCAICRTTPQSIGELLVDHNHQTGEVRGLLCIACNTGIGHLKDSPDVLRNAVSYLESLGYYGPDLEADA